MKKEIKILYREFYRIRNMGLIKSLRGGSTGIGYTFETLLSKKEDQSFKPDYLGIEIKTHLGYSKSPITLFNLTPENIDKKTTKDLLKEYGYRKNADFVFRKEIRNCFNGLNPIKYYFKLYVSKEMKKIILQVYNRYLYLIDDSYYWEFRKLQERLKTKLSYLAIVTGYDYVYSGVTYYKYTSMNVFSLKQFESFLDLVEKNKIFIIFNLKAMNSEEYGEYVKDHGTAFRIELSSIGDLFEKVIL